MTCVTTNTYHERRSASRNRRNEMKGLVALVFIASTAAWSVPASSGSASLMSPGRAERLVMATSTRGLLLMGENTGTNCVVYVSETKNSARSFSAPIQVGASSCSQENEGLVEGSSGVSLAYGNVTAVSDDWGANWSAIDLGGQVVGGSVSGHSIWISRLSCKSTANEQCNLSIYESSNGGKTWNKTKAQPRGARAWNGLVSVLATTVLIKSPTVGFVFSAPTTQLRPIHRIEMWSTTNGGNSWLAEYVNCSQGVFNGLLVSQTTGGALLALCAGQPFNGYQAKSVSISNSRGTRWTAERANGLGSKFDVGYADSIAGPSSRTIYEFGEEGPLHVSHDGGASWTDLANFGVVSSYPSSVQFINAKDGFALGVTQDPNSVELVDWVTQNSGRTWTLHGI